MILELKVLYFEYKQYYLYNIKNVKYFNLEFDTYWYTNQ